MPRCCPVRDLGGKLFDSRRPELWYAPFADPPLRRSVPRAAAIDVVPVLSDPMTKILCSGDVCTDVLGRTWSVICSRSRHESAAADDDEIDGSIAERLGLRAQHQHSTSNSYCLCVCCENAAFHRKPSKVVRRAAVIGGILVGVLLGALGSSFARSAHCLARRRRRHALDPVLHTIACGDSRPYGRADYPAYERFLAKFRPTHAARAG